MDRACQPAAADGAIAAERSYPMKPERDRLAKLLERVIYIGSSPRDIVFDCFLGSGTIGGGGSQDGAAVGRR